MQEVSQELWKLAVENAQMQQQEAFESLFAEAVEEHLKGDCADCEDGLCSQCEERIASGIGNWQESQFDDQVKAEYDRIEERREEQGEEHQSGE